MADSDCEWCGQTEVDGVECVERTYEVDGKEFDPIVAGDGVIADARDDDELEQLGIETDTCLSCGAPEGSPHHKYCDFEECPNCGEQLVMCDCETLVRLPDVD